MSHKVVETYRGRYVVKSSLGLFGYTTTTKSVNCLCRYSSLEEVRKAIDIFETKLESVAYYVEVYGE